MKDKNQIKSHIELCTADFCVQGSANCICRWKNFECIVYQSLVMSSLGSFKSYQTHQKNTRDFYMVRLHMPTSMGPRPARTIHYQIRVVNTPSKLKTNKNRSKTKLPVNTCCLDVPTSLDSEQFVFKLPLPFFFKLPLKYKCWNPFSTFWSTQTPSGLHEQSLKSLQASLVTCLWKSKENIVRRSN